MEYVMDTSKVTTNGQVTIPADFRRLLGLKSGDKVLFFLRENGDVVVKNASEYATQNARADLAGSAKDINKNTQAKIQKAAPEAEPEPQYKGRHSR
ncbi:MAG: AbrB/MazE/SpoVT family DNA-binding domain-containing protein [Coriobacteriia bacterium]|nr:AbrB/MazE/SpoVT family DNA-binding domain-containing protein [Coriobacteriia bacterium]